MHWSKIDPTLHQWLKERQALLVLYYRVAFEPLQENFLKTKTLQIFCQLLMDYLSRGHFQIFEKLALVNELHNPQNPELNKTLLNKILTTTHHVLDFHDKYTEQEEPDELEADLSLLGEQLAHRMECEDRLVQNYFQLRSSL